MSLLVGAASNAGGGYNLENSLRFRSSASAYLSRTPATSTSSSVYTLSMWVKIGALQDEMLFAAGASTSNQTYIRIYGSANQAILWETDTSATFNWSVQTNALLRDPSAWYHLVFVYDSGLSGVINQAKIYINGVQASGSAAGAGTNSYVNTTAPHYFARHASSSLYFDGYLTEINLIDGQALTPSDFGDYNEDTGVWQPIEYTGTYGTNGFYLDFEDTSSVAALGTDSSGNSNTWTVNNVSLTAGVTYDAMTDVPTLTDEDTANYAVLNPLSSGANYDLENGNLTFRGNSVTHSSSLPTILPSSGKYYFEFTLDNWAADGGWGVSTNPNGVAAYPSGAGYWWWYTNPTRTIFDDEGSAVYTSGSTLTPTGAVGQMAIDFDTNKVYIGINNTFYDADGSADGSPSTDVRPTFNIGGSAQIYPFFETGGSYVNINVGLNFGQRPFAYTPPTDYLKLNTFNLPDSSIVDGSENFNTVLYPGDGGTQAVTGVGFSPDLVWIKSIDDTGSHSIQDTVRGAGGTTKLCSNSTNAENNTGADATDSIYGYLTAFGSDGFTAYAGTTPSQVNKSTKNYASWNWKAGGTAVSNTAGNIASQYLLTQQQGLVW
jgi:hypothetical protein